MKRIFLFIVLLGMRISMFAQAPTATIKGRVTDQTGAVIPQATVTASSPDGRAATATTNGEGAFEIRALAPGSYTVTVGAKGVAQFHKDGVILEAGQSQTLNLALEIQTQEEKVDVQAEGTGLDVGSASNAGAVILT